jgi:hypothetical protein
MRFNHWPAGMLVGANDFFQKVEQAICEAVSKPCDPVSSREVAPNGVTASADDFNKEEPVTSLDEAPTVFDGPVLENETAFGIEDTDYEDGPEATFSEEPEEMRPREELDEEVPGEAGPSSDRSRIRITLNLG